MPTLLEILDKIDELFPNEKHVSDEIRKNLKNLEWEDRLKINEALIEKALKGEL